MTAKSEFNEDQYLASYYGEDIFDDLIEKALHSTSEHNDIDEEYLLEGAAQIIGFDNEEEDMDDTTPARESNAVVGEAYNDDASVDLEDLEEGGGGIGSDASSLDSKEISGQSILSDVDVDIREMETSYTPPPLINDDESTIDMRPPAPQVQTVSSFVEQLNRREKGKSKLFKAGVCALFVAIIVGVVLVVITFTGGNNNDSSQQMNSQELKSEQSTSSSSSSPTRSPVVETTPTIHLVQMTFQNVPTGYRLPAGDAASLVSFTTELLGDYVEDPYKVLEVAYAREDGANNRILLLSRMLSSDVAIPLRIVMQGPSSVTEESVRSYIIDILHEKSDNIVQFMKEMDWDNFNAVVNVTFDEFDLTDLVPTPSPSMPPQTDNPTVPFLLETGEPTATQTNEPSSSPSSAFIPPTTNPSGQPSITTLKPTLRPSYTPTKLATNKPTINGNDSATNPSATAPSGGSGSTPVGTDYFCAKTSYTESWNILMDFNCELPCPSGVLDCPGGHQCLISDYCSSIQV